MKRETRRLRKCYHTEAKRKSDGIVELSFLGSGPKGGGDKKLIIDMDFDYLPYLMRDIGGAWKDERARRISSIESIDKVIVGTP